MSIDLARIKEAAEKAHAEQAVAHTTTLRCVACKREFRQPAPAPTVPTSNALQDAISDWAVALPLEIQTPLRGKGELRKLRDAITDLFAKGGTP